MQFITWEKEIINFTQETSKFYCKFKYYLLFFF